MKKIIKSSVVMLAMLICANSYSQLTSVGWKYPVKPGTEEWKAFKNHQEMVDACQIPKEILSAMPTPELLETCVNFPLFGDILYMEHITDGVPILIENFNGLSELLMRKDCPEAVIDLYANEHIPETSPKESSEYFRMLYIEYLVGTSGIIEKLGTDTMLELMRTALSKIQEKKAQDYSIFYQSGSAIILSRALNLAGIVDITEDSVINTFNGTGEILDRSLIEKIETLTIDYLESHEKN